MGRGKRGNILGTRPETDPFEDTPGSSWSVTSDTELRWDERKKRFVFAQPLFLVCIGIMIGFYSPTLLLSLSVLILLRIILLPILRKEFEHRSLMESSWKEVQLADTSCSISDDGKHIQCKTPTGQRHLVNMVLTNPDAVLMGDVSSIVRAVDDSIGFTITVTMRPEKLQHALDEERIPDGLEKFFNYLKKGQLNSYVLKRGGIWLSHLNAVGHVQDEKSEMNFDSAVRASIPMEKWKRAKPRDLKSRLHQLNIDGQPAWFYASGEDLTRWVVQLRSELASEVGSNIPGQFLAPIRGRPSDYRLGVTINPDTLQTGPPVGIAHSELETGTLLCGGTASSRT
ncbi:MAG: hypothetical protein ACFFEV_03870, partial [Candidatus Thorarchaeota archaeon]